MTFAQNFLPPHTWVPFFNLVAFGKLMLHYHFI
jgi:hypothetical protein